VKTDKKTSKFGKNKKIVIGIVAIIAIIGIVSAVTSQPTAPAPSYIQQEKAQQAQYTAQNYESAASASAESGVHISRFLINYPPIRVGDGDNIIWCNSIYGTAPRLPADLATFYSGYQGADSCEEVRQWKIERAKSAPQGGGSSSIGQTFGGNYPGYDPNRDAKYAGGIGPGGETSRPGAIGGSGPSLYSQEDDMYPSIGPDD
jgi:hypothetical protein